MSDNLYEQNSPRIYIDDPCISLTDFQTEHSEDEEFDPICTETFAEHSKEVDKNIRAKKRMRLAG